MIRQIFYTYNNSIHSSTRVTPFCAYIGYHPHWCVLESPELPTNPSVEDHLEQLRRIQAEISTHLHRAQQTQKDYVDLHRLPSSFNIGVWILRKHNKTTRLCDKLDYQRLCPFCINKNDVTFRLALGPPQLRILHSSLLEPYRGTTIPDCITPPPPTSNLKMDLSTRLLPSSTPR